MVDRVRQVVLLDGSAVGMRRLNAKDFDAIEDLLARKPGLASRRITAEIGQGPSRSTSTVDLAVLLRQRTQ